MWNITSRPKSIRTCRRNPKDGNSPLKIGERGNGGTPFVGMIDDVRLWSMAKTALNVARGPRADALREVMAGPPD